MADIRIVVGRLRLDASLDLANPLAEQIFDSLPLSGRFERWGDEICLPLDCGERDLAKPVDAVQLGDIAYSDRWKMFCVFYGRTPLSTDHEIVPNGPVEIIGRLAEPQSTQLLRRFFAAFSTRLTRRVLRLFSPAGAYGDTITVEKR